MGKVTIVDVAKAANVSISSVSRYLANPKNINQIAAVRISKAISELNYIPNSSARNLKRGTTRVIGYIQPDITQELFNQATKALNEIFYQNDYLLITCDTDNNLEKELRYINTLLEQNVAGIIISPCTYQSEPTVRALSNCANLVYLDRVLESENPVNSVVEDNYEKCRLLADSMLKKGHKKHLILAGAEHSYVTKERLRGIMDTFSAHGITLNASNVFVNMNDSQKTIEFISDYLKQGYDSILFTNPKILHAILNACKKSRLKVNHDVFIGGYSYEQTFSQLNLDFPCILQHPFELGLAAGDLILKMIKKGDSQPRQIVVPCELRGYHNK